MAVKTELSPDEKELVNRHKSEVDQVAYEAYLRRIACGCLSCVEMLDQVTDTQLGELHVLIMHGNGNLRR